MDFRFHTIYRLVAASALAAGLASTGIAASAATITVQAATDQTTTAAAITTHNATASTANATHPTNVALSTADFKAKRQAEMEQANADARRVEFRSLGMSL